MSFPEFQIHSRLGFRFNSFFHGDPASPVKIVLSSMDCSWFLILLFGTSSVHGS